ncbi:MAG: hypothetical protein JNK92_06015 [Dechloromonas sp.]|nr:hypothetical protein [Dechloromonas sp.]
MSHQLKAELGEQAVIIYEKALKTRAPTMQNVVKSSRRRRSNAAKALEAGKIKRSQLNQWIGLSASNLILSAISTWKQKREQLLKAIPSFFTAYSAKSFAESPYGIVSSSSITKAMGRFPSIEQYSPCPMTCISPHVEHPSHSKFNGTPTTGRRSGEWYRRRF